MLRFAESNPRSTLMDGAMLVRPLSILLSVAVVLAVTPLFAADPPRVYADGLNHLYSLDFNEAEDAFRSLTRDYPDNPDYWNALASSYWLRILYNQQKLNMESFTAKDKFGTNESKDSGAEAEEKQLRDTVDKALAAADALLKKNPKDVNAIYAKGASYATLATFEATIRRAWLSAARKAKTARNYHKDVLKLDPNFNDARATVGIYNYAVGSLSWGARFLVSMVGLGGEGKEAGIKDLETAATKGTRSAVDAKMVLVVVYSREQQYDKALKMIDELHARYPRNFMLDMTKAGIYGKMKRWDLATQIYRQMAEKVASHQDGYDRLRIEKVYYELANSEFQALQLDDAVRAYARVADGANATPNEKATAHLWMGRIADTGHNRPDALKHYNAILTLDADPSIKSDAQRHIKKPFGNP
jgi:tetratricopeptide (TPR) repeat protein